MKSFLKLIAATVILISPQIYAQNITLEGKIIDSLGNPVTAANVVALNKGNQRMDGFAISDLSGVFKLNLKKYTAYALKISYLGFKTITKEITPTENFTTSFTMVEEAQTLDGVELTYEMPVSIQGDTIVYNADSFNTGTEKKLKDVLQNLPGIEINDEGQIEVEGKQVSKVMVEGKDFFDGDSKLATENIPANAIDKVQVLKNFNEVTQLSSVTNNEDQLAINIKLKKGEDQFWFGEVQSSVGNAKRYATNPKVFYYSSDFSASILGNINNTGQNSFSRRDYYRFTGGFKNLSAKNGSSINIQSDDLGLSNFQNNRAKEIENQFGATNFSYSPNEKLDLSGFVIVSKSQVDMQSTSIRTYTNPNRTEETSESNSFQDNELQLYKLSTIYRPNTNLQIDYDVIAKKSDEFEDAEVTSEITQVENISTFREQQPTQINQNLNVYYTLSEQHIFSVEAQHLFQEENPFYRAIRQRQPFLTRLPLLTNQSDFNINQNRNALTNKTEAKLDYFYVLTPKSNINISIGTVQVTQEFDSNMFQILDDSSVLNLTTPILNNDVTYEFSDHYLGFHYRVKAGKFTIEPGLSLHQFHGIDHQNDIKKEQKFSKILPDLWVSYNFKKSESLRFTYRKLTRFSDVNRLAEGFIFKNYNALFKGNTNLESATFDNYSFNYFSFNMFNFTNVFARLNYSLRTDSVINRIDATGINRVTEPVNSIFDFERLSLNGRIQKRFLRYKMELRTNFTYNKNFRIFVEDNAGISSENYVPTESFSQNYRGSFSTNFQDAPNFGLGFSYTTNQYDDGQRDKLNYITEQPFIDVDVAFLKGFILVANYSYYNYKEGSNQLNTYDNMSARLSYQKENSPWEFEVDLSNILDNPERNSDSFNDFFSTTTTTVIQPRYVIFSLKYNI